MGKCAHVGVFLNATYQQVDPFGKHSWHKHRRINTEMDVGSQSRSPLHKKGCKERKRFKLANTVASLGKGVAVCENVLVRAVMCDKLIS